MSRGPGTLLSQAASSAGFNRPHPRIADLQLDDQQFQPEDIRFATIEDCGFKNARFDHLSFHFVTFINCYFKSARFDSIRFEGCRFVNCDFHRANFDRCTFNYSEFEGTNITFAQVRACLPDWPNVRWRLAMNLKANAAGLGDTDDSRRFLLVELAASRSYNLRKAFFFWDSFYGMYPLGERIGALRDLVSVLFSGLVWGHAERPIRIGAVAGGVVLAFAWIYSRTGLTMLANAASPLASTSATKATPSLADYVEFSVGGLINSSTSQWQPANSTAAWAVHAEGVLGLILFGFLIAAIFRRFSRR